MKCITSPKRTIKLLCEELEPRLTPAVALPHPTNLVLQAEHLAVMNLVQYTDVTDTAISSGNWSDPNTWQSHRAPAAGANVLIPQGFTVTVDSNFTPALHTIRDDGVLQFSTTTNSSLLVDTIVVSTTGSFIMGTPTNPIPLNVHATVTFAAGAPIDTTWDPNQFSRGLISHGAVSINGAVVTPYLATSSTPHRGDTTLTLASNPVNWQVGDKIVLTGTDPMRNQDEELTILKISGNVVTVSALRFDHAAPAGQSVYVTDLARNVVFTSQDTAHISQHGHVMFMHSNNVQVANAGFYSLGRTDKSIPVDDPVFDSGGVLVPGTGLNPRGRYAVHVHRAGLQNPVEITGSVVTDSPGWGFVNHSSDVDFVDDVAYRVFGAAFAAEAGDEIGSMIRDLALRGTGPGLSGNQTVDGRFSKQDFGFEGHGFWLQGNGVKVNNDIAVGQPGFGYVFYSFGLDQPGLGMTTFDTTKLSNPLMFGIRATVPVDWVPLFGVDGDTAFACGQGLVAWRFNQTSTAMAGSTIRGLTTWNTASHGINFGYQRSGTYEDITILGRGPGSGLAITHSLTYGRGTTIKNARIEGWDVGFRVPLVGTTTVTGGHWANGIDFDLTRMQTTVAANRVVRMDPGLGTYRLGQGVLPLAPQEYGPGSYFQNESIYIGNKQLYYLEQAANYVPFPTAGTWSWVPVELRDKTNQQLFDAYGISILGTIAPRDAVLDASGTGLLGTPATYVAPVTLQSKRYTNQLDNYILKVSNAAGKTFMDSTPQALRQGWNLVTRTIAGALRTFFVYGDIIPPVFTPTTRLEVSQANLSKPFVLACWLDDDLRGRSLTSRTFTNLDLLPVLTKADGTRYFALSLSFTDFAGNVTNLTFNLVII